MQCILLIYCPWRTIRSEVCNLLQVMKARFMHKMEEKRAYFNSTKINLNHRIGYEASKLRKVFTENKSYNYAYFRKDKLIVSEMHQAQNNY